MSTIFIPYFSGEKPDIDQNLLPVQNASDAQNIDMRNGGLVPLYGLGDVLTLTGESGLYEIFKARYGANSFWVTSQYRGNFVNAPVLNQLGRFYYTDGVRAKKSNWTLASKAGANSYGTPDLFYSYGVPKPGNILSIAVQGSGTTLNANVAYVWTWVTAWGEESARSDPSDNQDINVDEYPRLSNFEEPYLLAYPYNVIGLKLYRLNTADSHPDYQEMTELNDSTDGTYIKIGNLSTGTGTITVSGTAMTGSGTLFSTELAADDYVYAAGQWLKIASVTNNTNAVLVSPGAAVNIAAGTSFQYCTSWMTATGYIEDEDGSGQMTSDSDLGDPIVSAHWDEPYDDIEGMVIIANNLIAAFRNNEFYITDPDAPYAMPINYQRLLSFDIISLGAFHNTIVAGTTKFPVVFVCDRPDAIQKTVIHENHPCLFKRSMVSGNGFCLYASPSGLVMISGKGGLENLTEKYRIFDRRAWKKLLSTNISNPTTTYDKTLVSFLYDHKYIAFFEATNDGFIIDLSIDANGNHIATAYSKFQLPSGCQLYGGFEDSYTDILNLLVKIGSTYYIKEWQGDDAQLTGYWTSKEFLTVTKQKYSCGIMYGDFNEGDVTLTIYVDGIEIIGNFQPAPNAPFRFGAQIDSYKDPASLNRSWKFKISTAVNVSPPMVISTSIRELVEAIDGQ